jgi:hypothetical protein
VRSLVLAVLISCTPAQAPRVHQVSEVAMLVGIGGLLAAGVIGALSNNKPLAEAGYAFAPVMVGGAAAFWISDKPARRYEQEQAQQKFAAAFELARAAKHAARAGDCAQVQAIEPRVAALDESVLRRFHHEPVIAACFPPSTPSEGSAR